MKVSTQPMSAFAVYSEKLKQKKKKTKPQVSNGINKVNKTQVKKVSKPLKSADKETWQMKEIGYILKKLAERSVDASSHRATDLLNSINEANKNLEHNVNSYFHKSLDRVILVRPNDLKKKSTNLKRKKGSKSNNSLHSNIESSKTLSNKKNHPIKTNNTSSPPPHKSKSAVGKKTDLKLKKDKEALKKGCKVATKSTSTVKSLRGEKNEMKSRHRNNLKKRKGSDQHEIKSDNVKKGKLQQLEASDATAKLLFEWLITPVLEKDFMSDFWEKKPLLIQRESNRSYYSELLSTEMIDTMLRENNVCFTKHLDVTSYTDGVRETHNLSGRAQANVVWDFYSNGCSVRLLNPQIFIPKIHALNATLQEYFGCFVGANVYLTPPNSQGFAPHYDDIEAFVLQIEGKKHWKVYLPRSKEEVLPRFSSPNFSQDEIGEPFLDVVLEPGDLLYFPRGFIHQATTVEGEHSLHITLSAYQKTAWVDLLEKVLPIALRRAAESDADFRAGLPRDYLGLEHRGGAQDKQRFVNTAQSLVRKLGDYVQLSLGAGVDLMGAQFMHDALPPVLTPAEKQSSSAGGGLKLKDGKLNGRVEFQMDTCVKLIRYNVCRLVEEQEGEARLFHCLDNSLEYHGEEPQFLVLPPEGVPVITQLQASYPAFVPVSKLPHDDPEALLVLISDLWDAGLLSAKNLPVVEES